MALISARLSTADRALIIDGFADLLSAVETVSSALEDFVGAVSFKLEALSTLTQTIGAQEMAAMDDLEAKMGDLEGAEMVMEMTLDAIAQEVRDMASGGSGATPERLKALADRVDALKQKAVDAVARDSDAAPAPAPAPAPVPDPG